MILDQDIARKTAALLLQIKAIKLEPQHPFTWSSGWKSPIYCDNRVILSHPAVRNFVKESLSDQLRSHFGDPDVVAGVATGGIGIGALVADTLNLPFVYVRPSAKKHGRKNQIEGFLQPKQNVVVIEDLISTGKSSLNAVKALEEAQATVQGMLAVFSYGFDVAQQNFEDSQVDYRVLSNYESLLHKAIESEYLEEKDLKALKTWRENPETWGPKLDTYGAL